jgi:hypothetical protein
MLLAVARLRRCGSHCGGNADATLRPLSRRPCVRCRRIEPMSGLRRAGRTRRRRAKRCGGRDRRNAGDHPDRSGRQGITKHCRDRRCRSRGCRRHWIYRPAWTERAAHDVQSGQRRGKPIGSGPGASGRSAGAGSTAAATRAPGAGDFAIQAAGARGQCAASRAGAADREQPGTALVAAERASSNQCRIPGPPRAACQRP